MLLNSVWSFVESSRRSTVLRSFFRESLGHKTSIRNDCGHQLFGCDYRGGTTQLEKLIGENHFLLGHGHDPNGIDTLMSKRLALLSNCFVLHPRALPEGKSWTRVSGLDGRLIESRHG